jgi:heme oxygenase
LRNLHAIYAALEAALARHPNEPALVALAAAPLHRATALAADLAAIGGPDWAAALPLAPSAQRYARRLQALADGDPVMLAAHAYVRYLGDLHGGQMLKRLVERSLLAAGDVAPRDAMQFYDFGSPAQVLALREDFRDGLARIEVGADIADGLVAEARWAFEMHIGLFAELAAPAQPASA